MRTNAPANDLQAEMTAFFNYFKPEKQLRLFHQMAVWIWKFTLKHRQEIKIDVYDVVNYLERLVDHALSMKAGQSMPDLDEFFEVYPVEMQYRYLYFLLTTVSKWQMGGHGAGINNDAEEMIRLLDGLFDLSIARSVVLN